MNAKSFLIILYLFCAAVLSAQNNTFIQLWERQARSRGASWNSYTRAATAADHRTYTSLYVNGKFIASFNNAGTCHAKISELKNLAENMYGKQSYSGSSSRNITWEGQATRDLERVSGVNIRREMQKANNKINKLKAEIYAQNKQETLSQIDDYCSCRTENNPNYNPNAKATGYDDLFTSDANNETDSGTSSNSLFADNSQTQYENIFDAPSARTPQQTNTGEKVSLNFDRGGIPVVDPDWTSDRLMREKDPIYLPDNSSLIEKYGKLKEKWENLSDSITDTDRLMREKEPTYLPNNSEWKEKINSQPFDMEVLLYKKRELELEYDDVASECNKVYQVICKYKLKKIMDKIEILNKEIAGREEWLNSLPESKEELMKMEQDLKTIADMAQISGHAYNDMDSPKKWDRIKDKTLLDIINNENEKAQAFPFTGFECNLLQNGDKYVISFRGTDSGFIERSKDMIHGWIGYLNSDAPQTKSSIEMARKIVNYLHKEKGIPLDNISTTGHSLGGHLAAEAALHSGLSAHIFNSMDISLSTKEKIAKGEIDASKIKIKNYVAPNDMMNGTPAGFCNVGENATGGSSKSTVTYRDSNEKLTKMYEGEYNYPTYDYPKKSVKIEYGNTIVIKENYEGHSINPLWKSIQQRYNDVKNKQNNIAQ
jgi:hypothetical protein